MDIFKNIENLKITLANTDNIDAEDKEFLEEACDELVTQISDYYCSIFDSETIRFGFKQDATNIKDYQEKVMSFDKKRRNMHNAIINNIVMIDRFCLMNDIKPVYGRLSNDELKNSNLIKDSNVRRTEVANDVIKAAGFRL